MTTLLDRLRAVTGPEVMLFPVRHGRIIRSVPRWIIDPHEDRVMKNHNKTLNRLAELGGLSPYELLRVLKDEDLFPIRDTPDDEIEVIALCITAIQARGDSDGR